MLVSMVLYADVPRPVVEQQNPEIRSDSARDTGSGLWSVLMLRVSTRLLIFPVAHKRRNVAACRLVVPH